MAWIEIVAPVASQTLAIPPDARLTEKNFRKS